MRKRSLKSAQDHFPSIIFDLRASSSHFIR